MNNQQPVTAVCFGEILWDVLPAGAVPGGAPMNVTYHLNKLGIPATLISKVGDDENGNKLLEFLKASNIPTTLIQRDEVQPTSTVIAVEGNNHEMQYEIVKPVAWDFINYLAAFNDIIPKTDMFIFGSLAVRNEHSRNTLYQLLNKANKKILDINLRPPHFEIKVIEELLHKTDVLKLNDAELDTISQWHADISSFSDKVRTVSDRYGIPEIIITKGANGAAYFDGEKLYQHPGFKVTVVDTIGSGDSFLAAFLSRWAQREVPEACLEFACKVGAFVASRKGACPEYKMTAL